MEAWQSDSLRLSELDLLLGLILPFPVLVRDGARFVGFKEENLAKAFVGENANRIRRGVRDRDSYESLPFRFERCDVDQDACARIGGLADAQGQHVTGNP